MAPCNGITLVCINNVPIVWSGDECEDKDDHPLAAKKLVERRRLWYRKGKQVKL